MNEDLDFIYDEGDAIEFIKNYLPQELKEKYTDEELYYFTDLIHAYYESQDFMNDEDSEEIVEIDEDEVIEFVVRQAIKEKIFTFDQEDIPFIVRGELEYGDSINLFD